MDDKKALALQRIEKGRDAIALQKMLIAERRHRGLATAVQESLLVDLESNLKAFEEDYERHFAVGQPRGSS